MREGSYFRYAPLQGLYDLVMPHSFGLTLHPIHFIGSLNLHVKTPNKFISVLGGHLVWMNIPPTPIHLMIYICLHETFSNQNQITYEQKMGKFFKCGVGLSLNSLTHVPRLRIQGQPLRVPSFISNMRLFKTPHTINFMPCKWACNYCLQLFQYS